MALPLTMTLAQLREQTLLRCGYAVTGNQASGVAPMVNSMIAGSERELFSEFDWLNAQKRTSVTLAEDDEVVDWPDDCEPGEIRSIWVVRAETGEMSDVMPGVLLTERNSSDHTDSASGRPLLYEYMEQQIYLKPRASADYTSLVITYKLAPALVQEDDRCVVDSELLIQRSVMKFKEYLGLPIGQIEVANHERYLARLRASNSQKDGFTMGGHKSWRTEVQKRNRIAKDKRIGDGVEYTEGWNPF